MVMDTPGVGDADSTPEQIHSEIRRGLKELTPRGAPTCLLLVLSLQSRVADDVHKAVRGLQDAVFGNGMLHFTLIIWTHADLLDGTSMDEYLEGADDALKELLKDATGGAVMLDNRTSRQVLIPSEVEPQVQELL